MKIFFFTVFAAFFLSAFGGVALSSESCEPYSKGEFGPAACRWSPVCGANEMPDGQNCVCKSGFVEIDGDCQLPPPAEGCRINQEWNGEECVCIEGHEPVQIGPYMRCALTTNSEFDTAEYRHKFFAREMGATYAYDLGYFGKGVTVVNLETMLASHEELTANIITMSIDYGWKWDRFIRTPVITLTGLTVRRISIIMTPDESRLTILQISDPVLTLDYHGTSTGGIIAAERNGIGAHGIAPEAKIVPLPIVPQRLAGDAPDYSDLEWILDSNIPFVNGSIDPRFFDISTHGASIFARVAESDTVFVWSRGNNPRSANADRAPHGGNVRVPMNWAGTEDNWLMVTGLSGGLISSVVTSCGFVMRYCMAAAIHGGAYVLNGPDNDDHRGTFFGTSASAPIVVGALAVLQSAAPMLPATMIRQILLTTAMDMGAPGIDEEYGWGVVNIRNGIRHIESLQTKNGILLRDLRNGLPSEFSHLHERLSGVSVALKITDDSYWNMPLTSVLTNANSQASPANAGVSETAAKEIMAAEYAPGESFRFWGGVDFDANGASQFIGEGGGAFGAESAEDKTGFIKWTTADYGGVSGFGEFVYTDIDAEYGGEGLVSEVRNAFGEEWKAGLEWRDIFRFGDRARFSVRQQKRIGGGEMVLRYPVADGDSHAAFIGETPQTIRMETARIPLKEKRVLIYGVGYSGKIRRWIPAFAGMTKGGGMAGIFGGGMAKGRDSIFAGMIKGGEWSAAAEWNSQTNAAAFWAELELEF